MSKPANVDIHNLFRKFGGDPDSYREIVRDHAEEKALDWPIIAAMKKELPRAPRLRQPAPINNLGRTASPAPQHHGAPATLFDTIQRNQGPDASAMALHKQEIPPPGALHALFGSLEAQNAPAQHDSPAAPTSPAGHRPESNAALAEVFSRLLDTRQPDMNNPPQNVLQNIFGRLNK